MMNRPTFRRPPINGETKLNIVLDNIPGALDYIVSLNPHDFSRLLNPVMRRFMSPRISLRRVAVMAGSSEVALLAGLAALADEGVVQNRPPIALSEPLEPPQSPSIRPAWLTDVNDHAIPWVDLLPLDDSSGDPFPPVSMAVKEMPAGSVVGIRHRWQPQPLYDVWRRIGIQWYAEQVTADLWHIYVYKPTDFGRKYI